MAYDFPTNVKFASVNLEHCRSQDDFADDLRLAHDLSIHRAPVHELGTFAERMGRDRAEAFDDTDLVIMASRPSVTPTILDHESIELDHRAHMMFYGLLMQGMPRFSGGTTGSGGTDNEGELHMRRVTILDPFSFATVRPSVRVSRALLGSAESVVGGMIGVYAAAGDDYRLLRRGVNLLVEGWKTNGALDRLHAFVRSLDGLMRLPQGGGRIEFSNRTALIATGADVRQTAEAIYRLRNYDEHLTDWPRDLAHVPERQRPEFVSRHAFLAETLANFAFRTVLSTPAVIPSFQTEATIQVFWTGRAAGWPVRLDLDAEAGRYFHIP